LSFDEDTNKDLFMAFCTACGLKNLDESKFCSGCGNKLIQENSNAHSVEPSFPVTSENLGAEKKKVSGNPFALPGQFIDAVSEETNVNELFKAFLMLIIIHAVFGYLMGSDTAQYLTGPIETIFFVVFDSLFIALSYFCVKIQGINKSKVGWIYFMMALEVVFLIITFIDPPEIEKFTKFDIYINYIAPLVELLVLGKMASLVSNRLKKVN
jgi:hypothetical protein